MLGSTSLRVSTIGLGTMQFGWTADRATCFSILSEYTRQGGNFLDTADAYSFWAQGNPGGVAETWIGEWLKETSVPRDQIIVATKVGLRMWEGTDGAGLNRAHIVRAVEDSLRRLQVEAIDLYQAHWPDTQTPIEETLSAFGDLLAQGKVRYVGCSNYDAGQLQEALQVSHAHKRVRYESLQPHYNLVRRAEFEGALMQLCAREKLGVIAYSPLARGFLTGRYRRGEPIPGKARQSDSLVHFLNDQGFDVVDQLDRVAQAHSATIPQVALAWLLANPVVTCAIVGASTLEQLTQALGDGIPSLAREEKADLDSASAWAALSNKPRSSLLRASD